MKRGKAGKATRRHVEVDEMPPEHDFSRARPNKDASRYPKNSVVVTLDPEVAAVFPRAREANDALRTSPVSSGAIKFDDRRDEAHNLAAERKRRARPLTAAPGAHGDVARSDATRSG